MGKLLQTRLTVVKEDEYGKFTFDFELKNWYTVVSSTALKGKTLFYNLYMSKCISEKRQDTVFINYTDLVDTDTLWHKLKRKNCLIIIDNADTVLTDEMIASILKNKTNQYLIFGNDPIRFCLSSDNSARLVKLDDKTIGLEYSKH